MPATRKQSALGRYLNSRILSHVIRMRLRPRTRVLGDLAGDHKSALSGFAVEFAGHRQYVPGDDIKHIDWRVYYKQERYVIKQYEAETNMLAHVLLDASESMMYGEGTQQKWEYAATLAATLTHLVVAKRDKASLGLFDDAIVTHLPPSQSLVRVTEVDGLLGERQPGNKTDIGRVLQEFAPRLGRRGMVLVISDFFDDVETVLRGVQRLAYDNHDVVLFHILHHDELTFPFDGNVRFDGFEGWADLKTDAQQVRQAYRQNFEAFLTRLAKGCERQGAEYVVMDTSVPLEVTLAEYLAGRN